MKRVTILVGDVREKLREIPEKSVHCVVTSPPYWGLRDYGTPPQVWGGDAECEHEWGQEIPGDTQHQYRPSDGGKQNEAVMAKAYPSTQGAFCRKCNAWLGNLGLEPTVELYVDHMVEIFREVRRVLRNDGTLWLNMGDCYATSPPGNRPNTTKDASGLPNSRENLEMRRAAQARRKDYGHLKPKDLVGQPWRIGFALQADGWYLRSDIIWAKPNPMPESCRDRPTKAHEYVFLLTKKPRYFFDQEAVRETVTGGAHARRKDGRRSPRYMDDMDGHNNRAALIEDYVPAGRNIRSVWSADDTLDFWKFLNMELGEEELDRLVQQWSAGKHSLKDIWHTPTQGFPEAHFATFPEKLVQPCIKAGTSEKGCCPACGAPWVRVTEKRIATEATEDTENGAKNRKAPKHPRGDQKSAAGRIALSVQNARKRGGAHDNPFEIRKTIGWQPSCKCHKPGTALPISAPVPCTVLDPFAGSGTTGLVAAKLARRAVLIELNPDYAAMAERRCNIDMQTGLFQS